MEPQPLLAQPFGTLSDLIHAHATQSPTHPALVLDEHTLDYATLDAWMDRVAASLQRGGVLPGQTIAICSANSLNYAAVFLGALRAGAAVAPLAPDTTPAGLAAMAADAGARLLFTNRAVADALQAVAGQIAARQIGLDAGMPGINLDNWLVPMGSKPAPVTLRPESPFNIIYSSGTTGTPKGIVVSHGGRWAQLQLFQALGYGPDAVTMVSIPLYSNMTLSSFLPALAMGSKVVLMAKFDAGRYLALSEQHRVTHSMMVPVQFQRIMARPDFDRYDLSSFRMKSCGSAPFAAALKADVLARWPGALVEYYGMTEGGGICVLPTRDYPDKLHTVGKPAPGHDIRLIDDSGHEVPPGEAGEIVGHSSNMMTGYHNLPEKTAQAEWFDDQGRRFIRSGDIGRFDEDGFLILLDRKKDMIISGGFNVYPSDLEAVLRSHPDVAEAAVFGVPSERWGETPVASVVLRSGATTAAETLLGWANGRLGKAQRLATVEVAPALPRSDIGKILKRALRDAYVARQPPGA